MNPSWLNSTVKCDVAKKLVKLWDFSEYNERTTPKGLLAKN